jgi:outer membrane protein
MMRSPQVCLIAVLMALQTWVSPLRAQENWSLDRCIQYALEHNLDVQLAGVGVEQADLNLQQSRLARLPNLNANASYGLSWGRFTNPDNLTIDATRSQSNQYSLNSTMPVFQGFGIHRTIRLSEDQRSLAEMDRKAAEDQVRLNVLSAYVQVLLAGEDLRSRELQVELSRDNLSNSRRLVEAGSLPEGNLRELEAQVATEELGILQADNNLTLALLQLRLVMQAEPDLEFGVSAPAEGSLEALPPGDRWSASEIYRYAERNLPALARNDLAEQVAMDNIQLARSGLFPSIGISGGASTSWFTEKALADFLPDYGTQLDNNFGQFVGIGLTIPMFNNGQVRNNIRSAELNLEQQRITAERERNTLRQTIEQAVAEARAAASRYEATLKVADARQLALEFAQKRFDAGQAPVFELTNARNLYLAAQADLLGARYGYLLAAKTLDFYRGVPLDL